jgi:phage-related minor tail protein
MADAAVYVARLGAKDETTAAFNSVQRNMKNTRKQSQALNQQFRFMRGGLGQVGHQVQDIAVQLQMGTNAMIVFGQQGSQIASLFGPQGAMIGALLAVGAAIGVSFMGDVKKGADALKDLTERIKDNARATDQLNQVQRAFLMNQLLEQQIKLRKEQDQNTDAITDATQAQARAKRMIDIFNGAQATGAEAIRANRTNLDEQTRKFNEQKDALVGLNAKQDDYARRLAEIKKEFLALQVGDNPYSEFPELAKAAAEEAKRFADQLERQNQLINQNAINKHIASLYDQLEAMEHISSAEKEAIVAQIERQRSLLEMNEAIKRENELLQKREDKLNREFGLFLQEQEALDASTEALERRLAAQKKLEQQQFEKSVEQLRQSLLTEEEAQAESLTRRREIINKALKQEGADKTMLTMMSMRLAQEEAEFREQVERRKMNAHDLFVDTAISGLDRFRDALTDNDKQALELAEQIDRLASNSMQSFTDSFYDAISGAKSFKDAFKDMARSIVEDLAKMLIQYYITQAVFGAITGAFPGGGSTTSGGTTTTPSVNLNPGGYKPRAMGGSVTGGRPYLVGERGPELFVPNSSGGIVANNKLGGGGVTIVQNINVTTGVQQTVRAEIANLMPQISNAAKSAVADARLRGGGYSKAIVGA